MLMREARAAGEEQVTEFLATLEVVVRQAQEIADGGDVYPAGVRDVCAKLVEHTGYRAQAIYSIMRPHTGPAPSLRAAEVPSCDGSDLPAADEDRDPFRSAAAD
jgi:hypothetical protein